MTTNYASAAALCPTDQRELDYFDQLTQHIAKRIKGVRPAGDPDADSWAVELQPCVGTLMLSRNPHCFIHATPGWEGIDLPIQLTDDHGNAASFDQPVEWTGCIEVDCTLWVGILSTVIATVQAMWTIDN